MKFCIMGLEPQIRQDYTANLITMKLTTIQKYLFLQN